MPTLNHYAWGAVADHSINASQTFHHWNHATDAAWTHLDQEGVERGRR